MVDKVGKFVPENVKTWWANTRQMFKSSEAEQGLAVAGEDGGEASWGVEEAQQRKVEGGASKFSHAFFGYPATRHLLRRIWPPYLFDRVTNANFGLPQQVSLPNLRLHTPSTRASSLCASL